MEYICPVLGEGDERDFIAIGQAENFKIAVFTNLDMYHEGCKYLGVTGYEPIKVSDELFKDLAKKDDEFTGIIVNIHNEKKIMIHPLSQLLHHQQLKNYYNIYTCMPF